MIDRTPEERAASDGGTTIENWSGSRRILYTPVSETEVYIALTMLHSDEVGRRVPIDRASWKQSFPHLSDLIDRFIDNGQYGRFEYIRLKSWSAGRVVILGDAAHALPPNIGQGAGCSMMNALSLAYYLDREKDMATALKTWETNERPMTEHTQRISVFLGLPTTWPTPLRRAFLTHRRQIEMDGGAAHQDGAAYPDGDVSDNSAHPAGLTAGPSLLEAMRLPGHQSSECVAAFAGRAGRLRLTPTSPTPVPSRPA